MVGLDFRWQVSSRPTRYNRSSLTYLRQRLPRNPICHNHRNSSHNIRRNPLLCCTPPKAKHRL